ncbi:MAG: CvpA family protein [Erysipelotrichaceae bacterium]
MNNYNFDFDELLRKLHLKNLDNKNNNGIFSHLKALIVFLVIFGIYYYLNYPVLSLRSTSSIFFMLICFGFFIFLDIVFTRSFTKFNKVMISFACIAALATLALDFIGGPIFQADKYHQQLQILEISDFSEDFNAVSMDKIPLVDKDTAVLLGDKKVGDVSGLGSQYYVNDLYTLVSSNDDLYRVSPLEYDDFIKWFQNNKTGTPGYIKVNVSNPNDVELVLLEDGLKYLPSAYLNDNLFRHLRFKYPTKLMTDYSFEIDDNGKPYWVVSTYLPEVSVFGGPNATGVIICDPVTGESEFYELGSIPEWVDRVQPSSIAWTQLNNYGTYVNGFFNTIFGQKDMLTTTDGYNYVNIDGQTNIFSGMTSMGTDNSLVGFALINLKTSVAKFYQVGGADEYSAMSSAEGQVQHLGYDASFPVLLNIADQPTYFVALKDSEGLVKMYAYINVTNYSIVGVGNNIAETQADYLQKLNNAGMGSNIDGGGVGETIESQIELIDSAIFEGGSVYYIKLVDSEKLFIVPLSLNNELPLTKIGDLVKIAYLADDSNSIAAMNFDNLEYQFSEN